VIDLYNLFKVRLLNNIVKGYLVQSRLALVSLKVMVLVLSNRLQSNGLLPVIIVVLLEFLSSESRSVKLVIH
jgi:hypothetical protein